MTNDSGGSVDLGAVVPSDVTEMEPQAAATEIERLRADDGFRAAYEDARHPLHKKLHGHLHALYERASPDAEYIGTPAADEDYGEAVRLLALPEDEPLEDARARRDAVASWLAALKLHPAEARQFVEAFNGAVAETEPDPDFAARGEKALKAIWGDAFQDKLDAAWRAVERIDGDGTLRQLLGATPLGEDPWVIRALADTAARNGW